MDLTCRMSPEERLEMKRKRIAFIQETTKAYSSIENARGIPSLDMVVRIANALSVTVDQLLKESYSNPEVVYLREIAERIEKYPVARRIQACEGLMAYLDSLEKFSQ